MLNPALPTSDLTLTGGPTFGPLPTLVSFARGTLTTHPGIAADILEDVERDLTRGLDLLASVLDDHAAGLLPAPEAMTAVRALARTLGVTA